MRNYITLNGKNSNEINGLLIQELPPISKPQIRTEVEEIDGRDGDIVTKLGFAAYDKEFTVGLYKDFDINAIIAYFNSEGTVVFSNEPDKYYNYQIIDQIDFERLVRYRTATVRMHCQPFKYSNTEGARTLGNKGTASGEGSFITLDNTPEAQFSKIEPKGNATQTTYSGKNLIPYPFVSGGETIDGVTYNVNPDGKLTASGTTTRGTNWYYSDNTNPIYVPTTGTYTLSFTGSFSNAPLTLYLRDLDTPATVVAIGPSDATKTRTVQLTAGTKYQLYFNCGSANTSISINGYAQLEAGSSKTDYEPYVGGTASPNPDYPQPISVVTGENVVKIEGKNLFHLTESMSATITGMTFSIQEGASSFTMNGSNTSGSNNYFEFVRRAKPLNLRAGTYTMKIEGLTNWGSDRDYIYIGDANTGSVIKCFGTPNWTNTFTLTEDTPVNLAIIFDGNATYSNKTITLMLAEGTTAEPYEPYHGQSYPISLGENYLARIPNTDYEDKPVKVGDTWYIRRMVGKVVLDGSESWSGLEVLTNTTGAFTLYGGILQGAPCLSNYFVERQDYTEDAVGIVCRPYNTSLISLRFSPSTLSAQTIAGIKTWLASHPTTVYYALAEPVDEEITNEALIAQLEALYNQAHAYKGRTHVAAIAQSGNAPHIIEAEVQRSSDGNITNNGNIVSKPTLTIYGSGNIGVSLNGYQILEITLGDEEYITIDTAAMEAYKDTLDNLKNRLVNGDYSKFALRPGSNMIEFSGTVSKCVISKYSRWL